MGDGDGRREREKGACDEDYKGGKDDGEDDEQPRRYCGVFGERERDGGIGGGEGAFRWDGPEGECSGKGDSATVIRALDGESRMRKACMRQDRRSGREESTYRISTQSTR